MHAGPAGAALLHVLPRSRWADHLLFCQRVKSTEAQVSFCHHHLMQISDL